MWHRWFQPKICQVCTEKDLRISLLQQEVQRLTAQLGHSREREERAVDELLRQRAMPSITPPPKLKQTDSEAAMEQAFGIFKDEDDKGDGRIQEVHNFGYDPTE